MTSFEHDGCTDGSLHVIITTPPNPQTAVAKSPGRLEIAPSPRDENLSSPMLIVVVAGLRSAATRDWQNYASFQHASSSASCARKVALWLGGLVSGRARSKIHQSLLGPGQGRLTSSSLSRRCYKDQRPFRSATINIWRAFSCSILHCSDTGEKVHLLARHWNRTGEARYDHVRQSSRR